MEFIRIRNFDKFQHYKDRNPPWIKSYFAILNDKDFFRLPDAQKFHVMGLMLIASQNDNRIALDIPWLSKQLANSEPLDISALIASGFVELCKQRASKKLSDDKQLDDVETETEKRQRREETDSATMLASAFEIRWNRYPNKDGKKQALRHWNATVTNMPQLAEFDRALENYLKHIAFTGYTAKNGSTFFNNWHDFIDWKEPERTNGNQQQESREQAKVRRNAEAAREAIEYMYGSTSGRLGSGDHEGTGSALPETPFGLIGDADSAGI